MKSNDLDWKSCYLSVLADSVNNERILVGLIDLIKAGNFYYSPSAQTYTLVFTDMDAARSSLANQCLKFMKENNND